MDQGNMLRGDSSNHTASAWLVSSKAAIQHTHRMLMNLIRICLWLVDNFKAITGESDLPDFKDCDLDEPLKVV
jgi:hypothetical protein